jgi:hypothetical protein
VQRTTHCIAQNQQKPIASIKQASYNETHNDWVVLVGVDFTLPFNEGLEVTELAREPAFRRMMKRSPSFFSKIKT